MPLPKKGVAVPISKIKEICELTEIPPGFARSILRAVHTLRTLVDLVLKSQQRVSGGAQGH